MTRRYIPLAAAVLAVLIPLFVTNGCANTTQSPTGGPKDTLAPLMLWTSPGPGTVNVPVHDASFQFGFDEYVKVKTATNIFVSPPLKKTPKSKLYKKSVIVWFEDEDLEKNTTYTISFTDAIADNNEGNVFPGYNYVFSTGPTIDSMLITGKVQDCSTLAPVKGATVMLYRDLADSALFKDRPFAATKTDEWGFFAIPFIPDTLYRLYAIMDSNNDNLYSPADGEGVAFVDSVIRPVLKSLDTIPEMQHFDAKDTLSLKSRYEEYTMRLFVESNAAQAVNTYGRTSDRRGYITFRARNVWIDSLWISGYKAANLITQFNPEMDSLEIWVNDRRPAPDTLHLNVNYRKTDTLGNLTPSVEKYKLISPTAGINKNSREWRSKQKHEDSICVFKLEVAPETVEQKGFVFEFANPIIYENFDSLVFTSVNPKQQTEPQTFTVEHDTVDVRRFAVHPTKEMLRGYEYKLKVPQGAFEDIDGHWSDSTEAKVSLPTDDKLCLLTAEMRGVDRKIIVDLLDDSRKKILRQYVIDSDTDLLFPYLKAGKYALRITDDGNRNGIVDTGNVLEHRQPETVCFYKIGDNDTITIEEGMDLTQTIDIQTLLAQ